MSRTKRAPFAVGDVEVPAGRRVQVDRPVARLFTGTPVDLTIVVAHGRYPGPTVWMDAAIHGDELNGIRIIRDVMRRVDPKTLRGTILAVPVVNVFGLAQRLRYLPDRRDLNRSFPGSARGSLASRLARLFVDSVVERCDIGLDLHTGGPGRTNLPHVRTDLSDPECRRLAEAFAPPLIYEAGAIPGSLRATALEMGKKILVYEAGEPLRFNRFAIDAGVAGVLRVLRALDMWDSDVPAATAPLVGRGTTWLRASRSGVFNSDVRLGDTVDTGQVLGVVSDPFPTRGSKVKAPFAGLVLGLTVDPLVHQGDALVHLVRVDDLESAPKPPPSLRSGEPASGEPASGEPASVAPEGPFG